MVIPYLLCSILYSGYISRVKNLCESAKSAEKLISYDLTIAFWQGSCVFTVEPRLSGPPLSGTSIIRLGSFLVIRSKNGCVPQMRMRVAAVTMETCLLIFCACTYNHVALLFINKVGGSRRGLSIRLSGIFTYPACFWNQGVRIIEVLLY